MASTAACSAACIELFARLWQALDEIPAAAVPAPTTSDGETEIRLQIVRLELALAIEACDPARRFFPLDRSQRLAVRTVLTDVLAALCRAADGANPAAIAWAQDRLLDAVLAQGPAGARATDRRPARLLQAG